MVGPVMLKILVAATLLLGSSVLLSNLAPRGRTHRTRRVFETLRNPGSTVSAMIGTPQAHPTSSDDFQAGVGKVFRTDEEWQEMLTPEQYQVLRNGATERPFTGQYWNHTDDGTYHCAACTLPIFDSLAKFESDTGWPSFTHPFDDEAISEIKDISYGTIRTEVVCRRCESHLGHVFHDGPKPTGLRYCVNSAALDFVGENDGHLEGRRVV